MIIPKCLVRDAVFLIRQYLLFELGNIPEDKAKTAFKRIAHKMPIKVRMVRRIHTV